MPVNRLFAVQSLSRSFFQDMQSVDLEPLKYIACPADPPHLDLIHLISLAQAEMDPCPVVALVAASQMHFVTQPADRRRLGARAFVLGKAPLPLARRAWLKTRSCLANSS